MRQVVIVLEGEKRNDGSVYMKGKVNGRALPMFSAIGATLDEAIENAIAILGPYFEDNFGLQISEVNRSDTLQELPENGTAHPQLPAHVIASIAGNKSGASCSPRNS